MVTVRSCLPISRTFAVCACFLHFWFLGRHSFIFFMCFCLLFGFTLASYECFCTFTYSVGAPLAFLSLFLAYWPHVCWLGMFLCIWLLDRSTFGISMPFCLLIGRTFAGFFMFLRIWLLGRSSFALTLSFYFLIGCTFAGCALLFAFGCSVGSPLAFPSLCTCLLAARLLVVHVFMLLFARYSLLYGFRAFLLSYWLHLCSLCMFLCNCFLGRRFYSVSLSFCWLIGGTFAHLECCCACGCSVGAGLAFPCPFACLLAARLPVVRVFALLVAR